MGAEKRTQNWILVIVVFIVAIAVPVWKQSRGEPAVKQGIDLVGGVDLLLQARVPAGAEEEEVTSSMIRGAIDIVRNRLDPEGVREIIIQQMGNDRIVVQIPGEDDPERVKRMVGATATLRFVDAGTEEIPKGTRLRFIDPETGEPVSLFWGEDVSAAQVVFEEEDFVGFSFFSREEEEVGELTAGETEGIRGPEARGTEARGTEADGTSAEGEIALELGQSAGIQLVVHTTQHEGEFLALLIDDTVRSVVEITETLTHNRIAFPGLADDPEFDMDELNVSLERVKVVNVGDSPPEPGTVPELGPAIERFDVTTDKIVLTGDDFASANMGFGRLGEPIISFEFKSGARRIFGEYTARHVGQFLAIALDDEIISCPVIREAILGGRGVIEGRFTPEEVQELVVKLNSGRLPVPLEIIENRTIGPTLGEKSIADSRRAAIFGAMLILLFMLLYYRLPGLTADIALCFYAVVFFGALAILNATLTLPGIAGFILSVGMAVDANVIIFERLKEELRTGKTFRSAVDAAFKRAFTAIFDANVTTLITALVLYNLGTGPIRGFAVTLSIGILVSMFSALVFTRLLLEAVLGNRALQKYWLFGVAEPEGVAEKRGGEA